MQLQNLNQYNNLTSFKSCSRRYNKINSDVTADNTVCTTTWLCRSDVDWGRLAKYIDNKFENKDKINTYCLACSDGTEAYSYAINLCENVSSQKLKKYNKIVASDIDSESINAAKSGRINLSDCDIGNLYYEYATSGKEYFEDKQEGIQIKNDSCSQKEHFGSYYSYKPTDDIKNMIEFKQSDMIEEIKNIKDDGNSVILCRNATPYMSDDYKHELVKTLKEKMHSGSILVIGDFDLQHDFKKFLLGKNSEDGYFKEVFHNVYERTDKPYTKNSLLPPPHLDTNRVF